MAEPLTLARSGPDAMPNPPRSPSSDHGERIAALEAESRASKVGERDLWTRVNTDRDRTRADIDALADKFRDVVEKGMAADKERAVQNAEFVTSAKAVLSRIDDVARRQDSMENTATRYRETNDEHVRELQDWRLTSDTKNRTQARNWAALAGIMGAALSAAFHKIWPN